MDASISGDVVEERDMLTDPFDESQPLAQALLQSQQQEIGGQGSHAFQDPNEPPKRKRGRPKTKPEPLIPSEKGKKKVRGVGPLKAQLLAMPQPQVVDLLCELVNCYPHLLPQVQILIPHADVSSTLRKLDTLQRAIWSALPPGRIGTVRDAVCFRKCSPHVQNLKREVVTQGQRLVTSKQWADTVEFCVRALKVVKATPTWDDEVHNKPRALTFEALAKFLRMATGRLTKREELPLAARAIRELTDFNVDPMAPRPSPFTTPLTDLVRFQQYWQAQPEGSTKPMPKGAPDVASPSALALAPGPEPGGGGDTAAEAQHAAAAAATDTAAAHDLGGGGVDGAVGGAGGGDEDAAPHLAGVPGGGGGGFPEVEAGGGDDVDDDGGGGDEAE